jgi:AraC-like DNA-binding protein
LPPDEKGWLSGFRDPYVGRRVDADAPRPAHPWTVVELGREVALSRSALAARFAHALGQSPMNYLSAWRMYLAAHMLGTSDQTIAAITEQIGYDSEPSFLSRIQTGFRSASSQLPTRTPRAVSSPLARWQKLTRWRRNGFSRRLEAPAIALVIRVLEAHPRPQTRGKDSPERLVVKTAAAKSDIFAPPTILP